ncbi:hypothetical protein HNP84_003090 [Thermocatellispora tengchongensis]|uniref:Uncharacterized protein n=1 Tax=Thermocatellispora tengchongensis TaxID=1073253 RepID=A0A840NWZ9_9ACTN|nr:hypothetical protein [Thermocatellispora tengchongensis]
MTAVDPVHHEDDPLDDLPAGSDLAGPGERP